MNVLRRGVMLPVVALLLVHVFLGWRSAVHQSVTTDEIFHITGGYSFNRLADYRIHPDNGVLPQRIHGLPALWMHAKSPRLGLDDAWYRPDVSRVCYEFFYERGNDHVPFLRGARALNLIFSMGVGLLVFAWARALAGNLAGLSAMGLAVLSPTVLAHGPLATTDMASALMLNASAGAFWLHLRTRSCLWTWVSAVIFALACVTKYSAVLLVPVFLVLIILDGVTNETRPTGSLSFVIRGLLLHAAMATLIIWASFGFRHSISAPGLPISPGFRTTWDALLDQIGWQGKIISQLRAHHILPEGFLWGYTHTYIGSLSRGAFLAGETNSTGWTAFFPLAFLWKSTLVELIGTLGSLIALTLTIARRKGGLSHASPLLAMVVVYGAAAITSHLNIGHRHLLPLYPAIFTGAGVAVGLLASRWRPGGLAGVGMIVAQGVTAATISPHFIAYFNPLVGGPGNGYRLLVDSSLDWGQDLSRVKPWLQRNNSQPDTQPVFLSYSGSGEPSYYGLEVLRLPFVNGFHIPHPFIKLESGIYMISATSIAQVYSPFRGPWTADFERQFQQLKALEPLFDDYAKIPSRRLELEREAPADIWRRNSERYDLLRFARLCHYLRLRPIDDHLGFSILVYRLSAAEVKAAAEGTIGEWAALIEGVTAR